MKRLNIDSESPSSFEGSPKGEKQQHEQEHKLNLKITATNEDKKPESSDLAPKDASEHPLGAGPN